MSLLRRGLAPVSERVWQAVDDEARRSLHHFLAGRSLFPFVGPKGYEFSAVPTGRRGESIPLEGVDATLLGVQPLIELRAPFSLSRDGTDLIERGADDVDLSVVVEAARRIAGAEDHLIFDGCDAAGIMGAASASPHDPLLVSLESDGYPRAVAKAVAALRAAGVGGPYGIALGSREHLGVIESTERGGYPVLQHLHLILDGPVVWAPAVDGAVVASLRGGDFEIVTGLDFAVGYRNHTAEHIDLELIETVAFRNLSPEAAIVIQHRDAH